MSDQLRQLEERLAQRRVATREELEQLLAETFVEFGASGREYTRTETLDAYELGANTACVVTSWRVVPLGTDSVLATYQSETPGGRRARRSSLWVRREEQWQMLFHQGTLTV